MPARILIAISLLSLPMLLWAQVAAPASSPDNESEKEKKSELLVMNPFVVKSDNAGYQISNLASATHMNVPIVNIPAAISVVTSAFMKDQGAFDFRNAISYTTGVTQRINTWDGLVVYGFTGVISYVNGISSLPFGNSSYTTDMAFIDRIEIIKGPAAAIGGTSAGVGFANKVTKQPIAKEFLNTSLTLASYNYLRMTLDTGGTIYKDANQSVLYRLVAAKTDGGGYKTNMLYKTTSFYPAVTWLIGKKASITASGIFMDGTTPSDFGTLYYPGGATLSPDSVAPKFDINKSFWIAPKFDINSPGQGNYERPKDLFLDASYTFNEYFSVRNVLNSRSIYQRRDGGEPSNVAAINGVVPNGIVKQSVMYIDPNTGYLMLNMSRALYETETRVLTNQLEANLQVNFLGVDTKTNFGLIHTAAEFNIKSVNMPQVPYNLTLFANSQDYSYPRLPEVKPWAVNRNDYYKPAQAYFFNHQSYLFKERLIITAGGRWDHATTYTQTNKNTGVITVKPPGMTTFSKMYAVMVKPYSWLGIYGSYNVAAAPTQYTLKYIRVGLDYPGNALLPYTQSTDNTSFGAKAHFFEGRFSVSLTRFNVIAHDTVVTGPIDGFGGAQAYVMPGNTSKGWDLEFSGLLTEKLEIIGGYVYDKTGTAFNQELRGVPLHKFQGFFKYDLGEFNRNKWNVRLGIQSETEMWGWSGANLLNNTFKFPGATQFDAGVGVDSRSGWTIDFMIRNLNNVVFAEHPAAVYSTTMSPARTVIMTFGKKW